MYICKFISILVYTIKETGGRKRRWPQTADGLAIPHLNITTIKQPRRRSMLNA